MRSKIALLCNNNFLKIIALGGITSIGIFIVQDHQKLFYQFEKASTISDEPIFEVISLPDAIQYFYDDAAIFIDVRESKYYKYGHIERAINLPASTSLTFTKDDLEKLTSASSVIIYCNGSACATDFYMAKLLMKAGLDNVKIYQQGWPEWKASRLPVTMSAGGDKNDL